jgi:competence protein ComEC
MNMKQMKRLLKIQWIWHLFSFLLFMFFLNISYKYFEYKNFISKAQFITAKIVNQYKKKNYWVLKLKNNKIEFYTTTKDDLKDILNSKVEVGIITKRVSFWQYLTIFYAPTFNLGILEKEKYKKWIENQHKNKYIANIFNALFFGDSLYYKTRQELSTLGISHLLALSGLHLAIISGILYLILTPFYNFFMPPYRNRNIDLGIIILMILFCYLYFVGFPPSLVRSFLMEIIAFIFAFYLRDILSFKLLFLTAIFGIIIFPSFLVSIGFFLSLSGVFLIFLFFKYFKPTFINGVLILPIYLYFAMILISHYFFGNFNFYQLFSPFVSIFFTIFYPFELFLHLIGEGGILDEVIKSYLTLGDKFITFYTPSFLFYIYLGLLGYFAMKKAKI